MGIDSPRLRCLVAILVVAVTPHPAHAWDERGHAIVTRLAVAELSPGMPAWLSAPEVERRLVYLSNEPDRWRGTDLAWLDHVNKPDHYLDIEMLAPYGLTLKTLPKLRYEYVGLLAAERALHPDRFPARNAADDPDSSRLTPGMLPYRIIELYAELAQGWATLRTLEANPAAAGPDMIAAARERIVQSMGLLSHYVADAAQPLHTTHHFNGWVGDNPNAYTTDHKFHAYIDGGVLRHHGLTSASLFPQRKPALALASDAVWDAVLEHIDRSHRSVEPLYRLEKSDELNADAGRAFIAERLTDAGALLAGLWNTAAAGPRTDAYLEKWLREPDRRDTPAPATTQATTQATQPVNE